jgi:hypothetical protein
MHSLYVVPHGPIQIDHDPVGRWRWPNWCFGRQYGEPEICGVLPRDSFLSFRVLTCYRGTDVAGAAV